MNKPARIATAGCACALAVGLGALVYSLNKNNDNNDPTVSSVTGTAEPATEPDKSLRKLPEDWASGIRFSPSEHGMTERAKHFLKINPDISGWIRIPDTQVDYPIVTDPGEIKANSGFYGPEYYIPDSYYLDHDIDGSYLRCGSLFFDYRNVFGSDEEDQSENLIIYGHNMANNSMFGSLRRYRQDYSFYDQSPFIELSSNYRDYDYVIFAFLITSGNYDGNDFVYWNMEDLDTKKDFDFYVDKCKSKAMIDTGVDVQYGDKLLTLSTCYADEDNSRFLVVARRLRDDEKAGDMSTVHRTEEWKKAHETQPETTTSDTE